MNQIVTVSAGALRLTAGVQGVDDVRTYLKGVNIEPRPEGGAYVIGSDGHVCVVVVDKQACWHGEPHTLTVHLPDKLRKSLPRYSAYDHQPCTISDSGTTSASGNAEAFIKLGESLVLLTERATLIKSPTLIEWRRLIPAANTVLSPTDDYIQTALMRDVFKGLGDGFNPYRIMTATPGGLQIVHLIRHPEVFVAVMPMREDGSQIQAWRSFFATEATSPKWEPPLPEMMVQDPDHPQDEPATAETAEA